MKWHLCDKCHGRYANPQDLTRMSEKLSVCFTCLLAAVEKTLQAEPAVPAE